MWKKSCKSPRHIFSCDSGVGDIMRTEPQSAPHKVMKVVGKYADGRTLLEIWDSLGNPCL